MASNHTFGVVCSANDGGLLPKSVCVFGRIIFDIGAEQNLRESVGVCEIFGGSHRSQGYGKRCGCFLLLSSLTVGEGKRRIGKRWDGCLLVEKNGPRVSGSRSFHSKPSGLKYVHISWGGFPHLASI